MTSITKDSIVSLSKDQISCDLAGEAVILNFKDSTYYGLDNIGTFIWNNIQDPKKVEEIIDSVLCEYDVNKAQCENDLLILLNDLKTKGLIEIKSEKDK